MIESWDDLRDFLKVMFHLGIMIGVGFVAVLAFIALVGFVMGIINPEQPYLFDYPAPLDVCPQTLVNSAIRDNVISVDYINQRGDAIYLTYAAQRGAPAIFTAQQVLAGNDCPQ